MAEPVEITQKLKDFFRSRNQEVAYLQYVGTGPKGEPAYLVSDIPIEVLRDCHMGGPMFVFVDKDNIRNSELMHYLTGLEHYEPDPDLPYDPVVSRGLDDKK